MHKHAVLLLGMLCLLISCTQATSDAILTVPEDATARYELIDIEGNTNLAKAIIDSLEMTIPDDLLAPALVVGKEYLTGDMLNLGKLTTVFNNYSESGSLAFWYTLEIE